MAVVVAESHRPVTARETDVHPPVEYWYHWNFVGISAGSNLSARAPAVRVSPGLEDTTRWRRRDSNSTNRTRRAASVLAVTVLTTGSTLTQSGGVATPLGTPLGTPPTRAATA